MIPKNVVAISPKDQDTLIDPVVVEEPKKNKKYCPFKLTPKHFWQWVYPYILMLWDGNSFFGFDDTKLARLKGKPVTFFSKFSSIRWVILTFGSLIGAIVILYLEVNKFGSVKSKDVSLVTEDFYSYEAKDALTVMLVNWFWLDDLIPRT
jgi:hypothetical protein